MLLLVILSLGTFFNVYCSYVDTQQTFLYLKHFPTVMRTEAILTVGITTLPSLFTTAFSIINQAPGPIIYQSLITITSIYSTYKDLDIQKRVSFKTSYYGQSPNSKLLYQRESNFFDIFFTMCTLHALFLLCDKNSLTKTKLQYICLNMLCVHLPSCLFTFLANKRLNGKIPLENHLD